jgi:hypothetical protein
LSANLWLELQAALLNFLTKDLPTKNKLSTD